MTKRATHGAPGPASGRRGRSRPVPWVAALLLCVLGPGLLQGQAARPTAGSLATTDIAARAMPATVTIVTMDARGDTLALGSGFLVRSSGVIVTNWHVMAGASRAVVMLATRERFDRVEVIDGDSVADLAVLKVPGYGLPVLRPSAALPPVGARIVAIGSPLGLSQTVSEGIVSATRMVDGRQLLQMSAPISHGSSGGPVLNDRGEVVAVATSYIDGGQQLNFAVPVRYAMGYVDQGRAPQSLARVFARVRPAGPNLRGVGASPPSRAARGQAAADTDGADQDDDAAIDFLPIPAPTGPRATLVGVYKGVEILGTVGERSRYVADVVLVLGDDDTGWRAVRWRDGSASNPRFFVSSVVRAKQNASGQMALESGGIAFSGTAAPGGLALEGWYTDGRTGSRRRAQLFLGDTALALTDPSGVYAGGVRTQFSSDGRRMDGVYTEWAVQGAVVQTADSLWIDMTLRNDAGGSVAAAFMGPVASDGAFRFYWRSDEDRNRWLSLVGWARNGRIVAEWKDHRRDGSMFTGRMQLDRQ